jgi:glycosyltransferase involved in cell wall biosynthesis
LPNFIGGAELIAHYQAKELKKLGHEVVIFTGDLTPYGHKHSLHKDFYDNLPVYRIYLDQQDYSPEYINFSHLDIEKKFEKILIHEKPDVVHVHNIIGLSMGIILVAKKLGIKTISTLHDHWGFCYKNTLIDNEEKICMDSSRCSQCMKTIEAGKFKNIPVRMRKDYFNYVFDNVDGFITPSQYLANTYIKNNFVKNKFFVIWNGLDINRFSKIKKIPSPLVRFTFIGHLGKHKGVHLIIEALNHLKKYKKKIFLNVTGTGEELNNLQHQVEKYKLTNIVKFWGKVDHSQIENAYKETDILILPSRWPENQPVSITEAMACSTPIIGTDIGGIPELVKNNKNGYTFQINNSLDLSHKMEQFILNKSKVKSFGYRGYEIIKNNSYHSQVKKIVAIYKKIKFSTPTHNKTTITCVGDFINHEATKAINSFGNNHQIELFMSDWIPQSIIDQSKLIWITDDNLHLKQLIHASIKRIPILLPSQIKINRIISKSIPNIFLYDNSNKAKHFINSIIK